MIESMSALTGSLPAVVHIVRRYGRVGGMESYVWELTKARCAGRPDYRGLRGGLPGNNPGHNCINCSRLAAATGVGSL